MTGILGLMESPRTVSSGLAYALLAYTSCDYWEGMIVPINLK